MCNITPEIGCRALTVCRLLHVKIITISNVSTFEVFLCLSQSFEIQHTETRQAYINLAKILQCTPIIMINAEM